MPIEAVKIPQNVQIEDKIIGPISLRMIIIMLIGGGISYLLFAAVQSAGVTSPVALVATWIPLMVAVAFSFIKVHDMSLFRIVLLMLERTQKPNIRVFTPRKGRDITAVMPLSSTQKSNKVQLKPIAGVRELSTMLDEELTEADLTPPAEHEW